MKTNTSIYLALTALLTALSPAAFGQASNAANAAVQNANAAANAATRAAANAGQNAAQQSAAATNAAAQGAANAAAHSPAITGATSTAVSATTAAGAPIPTTPGTVNAGVAGSANTSANASRHSVNDSTNAGVKGTATAPGLNRSVEGQVSASLNTTETTTQIRNSTFENRDAVIAQVDSTLKATHTSMAQLRQRGSELSGAARDQFKSAYEQLRLSEQALRDSLRNARRATATTYADAQAKLAADYDAYAQAVAAAEAAGVVSTTTP